LGEAGSSPGLAVRQVYWVNGKLTASDLNAKLQGALTQLLAKGDDSAVIVIYALMAPDSSEKTVFDSFVGANGPAILKVLDDTAAQGKIRTATPKN
jgi:hypothetical protein